MPIEINELHIKINVDSEKGKPDKNNKSQNKQDVVATCVEQVMELLALKKER